MWEDQEKIGIPKEYRYGHGWHTYWLYSFEKNVALKDLGLILTNFLTDNPVFNDYNLAKTNAEYFEIKRTSRDGTVNFRLELEGGRSLKFSHNINGRDIYALGNLDAIRFLYDKYYNQGEKGKVYDMVDVLKK